MAKDYYVKMRTFIGVWLSPEMRRELSAELDGLRKKYSGYKWTSPENLHFTLKFLGEVEPGRIAELEKVLGTVSIGVGSVRIQLGKPGFFPPKGAPRIMWIGLSDGAIELKRLADQVEFVCLQKGFPKEDIPFQPHLTIARVRTGAHPQVISDFSPQFTTTTTVTGFSLIESRLYSTGPVYRTIADFSLE